MTYNFINEIGNGIAITTILIAVFFIMGLTILDFGLSIYYLFKGNKTKILSQDTAKKVLNSHNVDSEVVGGWIALRFWNYSKRRKRLKLRKPFTYNRKNMYGMVSAASDAYYGALVEKGDKRRFIIKFAGTIAPLIVLIAAAATVGLFVATDLPHNELIATVIFGIGLIASAIFAAMAWVYLKKGVLESLDGKIDERDLKSMRFYFNVKIALAVVTAILQAIEIAMKIADQAEKKN